MKTSGLSQGPHSPSNAQQPHNSPRPRWVNGGTWRPHVQRAGGVGAELTGAQPWSQPPAFPPQRPPMTRPQTSVEHVPVAKLAAPAPQAARDLGSPVPQNPGRWPGTAWVRQAGRPQDQSSCTLGVEWGPGAVKPLPPEPSSKHTRLCPRVAAWPNASCGPKAENALPAELSLLILGLLWGRGRKERGTHVT